MTSESGAVEAMRNGCLLPPAVAIIMLAVGLYNDAGFDAVIGAAVFGAATLWLLVTFHAIRRGR